MRETPRNQFTFYRRWLELLKELTDPQALAVLDAMMEYGLFQRDTEISDPTAAAVWADIRADLSRDWKIYEARQARRARR